MHVPLSAVKHVPCASVVGPRHVIVGAALTTRNHASGASAPHEAYVGAGVGAVGDAVGAVGARVGAATGACVGAKVSCVIQTQFARKY